MIDEDRLEELFNGGYVNLSPTEQLELLHAMKAALKVVRAVQKNLHSKQTGAWIEIEEALAPFEEK